MTLYELNIKCIFHVTITEHIYIKIEKTEYIHALFPVTSCGIVHLYKCNTIFTQR